MTVVTPRILRLFAVSAALPLLATHPSDARAAWNADVGRVLPAEASPVAGMVPVNDDGLLMPDGSYPRSYGPGALGYYEFGGDGYGSGPAMSPSGGPASRSFLPGSRPGTGSPRSTSYLPGSAATPGDHDRPVATSGPRTAPAPVSSGTREDASQATPSRVSDTPSRVPAVVPPATPVAAPEPERPEPPPAMTVYESSSAPRVEAAEPDHSVEPPAPPVVSAPPAPDPVVSSPSSPPPVPEPQVEPVMAEPAPPPPVQAEPRPDPRSGAGSSAPSADPVARATLPPRDPSVPFLRPYLDDEVTLPPLALFPSVTPPPVAVPGTLSERAYQARLESRASSGTGVEAPDGPSPSPAVPEPPPVREPGPPLVVGMTSLEQLDDTIFPGMPINAHAPLPGRAMTVVPGYQKDPMDMSPQGAMPSRTPAPPAASSAPAAASGPSASSADDTPSPRDSSSSRITGSSLLPPQARSSAPAAQGPVPLVPEAAPDNASSADAGSSGQPSETPGEVARAVIEYAAEATAIPDSDVPELERLAGLVLDDSNRRLLIQAYAGANDETGPNRARRVSLTRALAIRTFLLGRGIPAERIEVRALGEQGARDGKPDRTDIVVLSQ